MKNIIKLKFFAIFLFSILFSYSQTTQQLEPGVDRWKVKTSAEKFISNDKAKSVSLETLLALPLLEAKYNDKNYPETLIPKKVGTLKEGDIITTKGYLHLVALENSSKDHRDGDYHIQITLNPEWSDSCFIVEIPYEEFVSNADLKSLCAQNRKFIRKNLLHDEKIEPITSGNVMN